MHGPPKAGALTGVAVALAGQQGTPRQSIAQRSINQISWTGVALIKLGDASRSLLPLQGVSATQSTHRLLTLASAGDILFVGGSLSGLLLWAFSMAWIAHALCVWSEAALQHHEQSFGIAWWSLTFPSRVFILLALGGHTTARVRKLSGKSGDMRYLPGGCPT